MKTHEFTGQKMKAINAYSLTQFHMVVDAQDSPKISQKGFFHQAAWAGSSNNTLQ